MQKFRSLPRRHPAWVKAFELLDGPRVNRCSCNSPENICCITAGSTGVPLVMQVAIPNRFLQLTLHHALMTPGDTVATIIPFVSIFDPNCDGRCGRFVFSHFRARLFEHGFLFEHVGAPRRAVQRQNATHGFRPSFAMRISRPCDPANTCAPAAFRKVTPYEHTNYRKY